MGNPQVLRKHHVKDADKVATKLHLMTETVLQPPDAAINSLSSSIAAAVNTYYSIDRWILEEENTMARCLVQTPGFYLTSFPGVAVVLAAGIMGEFGGPGKWNNTGQMASNAGICTRLKQTGGPDKQPIPLGLPKKYNRRLKDYLLQVGFNMGKFTHPAGKDFPHFRQHRLYRHFWNVENRGSKSGLSTAKKFLGIASQMISWKQVYMPEVMLKHPENVSREETIAYFLSVIGILNRKWSIYDLAGIPKDKNYFEKEKKSFKKYQDYINKVRTS